MEEENNLGILQNFFVKDFSDVVWKLDIYEVDEIFLINNGGVSDG